MPALEASDMLNFLVKIYNTFFVVLASEDVAFRWAERLPIAIFFLSKGSWLMPSVLSLDFSPVLLTRLTGSFFSVFLNTFFFLVFFFRFLPLLWMFVYPSAKPVKAAAAAARPSIARPDDDENVACETQTTR